MSLDNAMQQYISYSIGEYRSKFFSSCDCICYYGDIYFGAISIWKHQLEPHAITAKQRGVNELVIFLYTTGGSVESVEKMVDMTRRFYEKVYFVIPNIAMSAGTIWAMSGDKIYMNYASSLGPIDPQVQSPDGKWVPALGYLDKANEIIKKSENGSVTQAELMMLNQLDLAQLRRYEQAVELSIDLLKKWLVKYKFKEWQKTETSQKEVCEEDKLNRAKEIAKKLSDNKKWHSHGRMIGIEVLTSELKLLIDDFTDNQDMTVSTENLHQLLIEFMYKSRNEVLILATPYLSVANYDNEGDENE
ncbi:SDH family Clp fold serine proteinase [Gallibacterium sp. AGMB14963]|uniref:SDH family Clp fold serine proteinase n=1 Tax=Gallibacterium faecale TaxID=3019086 RepID=UPI0022F15AD6|nr:hypothetical protein [Gallibacterium sp. AGMB14963]MDA3978999.1 hypothetical protein [Gallibacterium sp. AGMB14963]